METLRVSRAKPGTLRNNLQSNFQGVKGKTNFCILIIKIINIQLRDSLGKGNRFMLTG